MKKKQEEFSFSETTPAKRDTGDHAPPLPEGSGDNRFRELIDSNFLQYASYVVCERAIPDLADGLKPVQRRILHSLHEKDDGRFTKVANVVGHCMQYHPHGDASIGDALVGLVSRRYLIEGQGNFGNVLTGDAAAAPRYIECRLTALARHEVLHKELSTYVPSYDGRNKEPTTLPARIPLLLMMGSEGIAVGLSTRILPHNFSELLEAQIAILRHKSFTLLPDFPQGGLMDAAGYDKGNGRVRLRARIEKKDDRTLVITEVPYGTTTESLIASIEDAARKKKVPVRKIDDFTSSRVEIQLRLASGANPDKAIASLYAFTSCEGRVSGRVVVIDRGRPRDMDVHEVLKENTRRLLRLLEKELHLREKGLEDALHEKTLVRIFVENRIYKRIEKCKTAAGVKKAVVDGFEPFREELRRALTPGDVEMLLGVRIRRISLFDMEKHRKEMDDIARELAKVRKDLSDVRAYAIRYLQRVHKTYAADYPRRTECMTFDKVEVRELTANELRLRYDRASGYLGFAAEGKELLACSSLDKLLLVWRDGRYRVVTPPEKLFVDKDLLLCEPVDREKVFTLVFTQKDFGFTYLKRFAFGGTILNKEYRCAPEGSKVLLFTEGTPETIFVKYKPAKGQRIHQQVFHPGDTPVKGVRARGNQMTSKQISRLATTQPSWWEKRKKKGARGRVV